MDEKKLLKKIKKFVKKYKNEFNSDMDVEKVMDGIGKIFGEGVKDVMIKMIITDQVEINSIEYFIKLLVITAEVVG